MKLANLLKKYILPKTDESLFLIVFAGTLMKGSSLFNADGDLGRHITIGRFMLENRTIPTYDLFSHTMIGQALTPHEWLAQILFAGVHNFLGLSGPVWLSALIIALAFQQVYRYAVSQGAERLPAAGLTILAAFASSIHWLARPHIFTFLILAIWAGKLAQVERMRTRELWIFPAIMLLWANIHGAFIAGFVTWGAYLAGAIWEKITTKTENQQLKKLSLIGIFSFAISFINPSGWHLWQTSVGYIQNRYLVAVTYEYQSPNFHQFGFIPFLFFLALALFILTQKHTTSMRMHNAFLLSGWTMMALYSARNIPLMVIIVVPILGAIIKMPSWLPSPELALHKIEDQLRYGFWSALAIILVLIFLVSGVIPANTHVYNPERFPVEAVNWLEENPQSGNVFNYFTWGGYLLYRLYPGQLVFIDGQTDFYGEALTREYASVITVDDGWGQILDRYQVEWAIIRTDSALSKAMMKSNWQVLYSDTTTTIFRR